MYVGSGHDGDGGDDDEDDDDDAVAMMMYTPPQWSGTRDGSPMGMSMLIAMAL